jgi:hypothetical protein
MLREECRRQEGINENIGKDASAKAVSFSWINYNV